MALIQRKKALTSPARALALALLCSGTTIALITYGCVETRVFLWSDIGYAHAGLTVTAGFVITLAYIFEGGRAADYKSRFNRLFKLTIALWLVFISLVCLYYPKASSDHSMRALKLSLVSSAIVMIPQISVLYFALSEY